jgi:predicted P-loop ATPase
MAEQDDPPSAPFWMRRLKYPANGGEPWPTLGNAILILTNDTVFAGMFGLDRFTGQRVLMRAPPRIEDDDPEIPGPYPRGWTEDEDVSLILAWMQGTWGRKWARNTIVDAMIVVSRRNTFHPILDWIDKLVWDGQDRLDTWLRSAFDVKNEFNPLSDDPAERKRWKEKNDYFAMIGARFLIAAVRRLRQPGCKFDHLLILEGAQRIGKSTAVALLFGAEYFTDDVPTDLKNKDAALGLHGKWCIEFAEIEHLVRTEVEVIKAFLSRATDHYRPPYGEKYIDVPRASVLIGTTNSDDYLRDGTGNTRMWPAWCQSVDLVWLAMWRDQLWAEAAAREAKGEVIWLDDEKLQDEAKTATAHRLAGEVWEPAIVKWLGENALQIDEDRPLTIARVLEHGIGMSKDKMTRASEMRVGAVLRSLGYQRKFGSIGGKTIRVWRMPDLPNNDAVSQEKDWSEDPIGFG